MERFFETCRNEYMAKSKIQKASQKIKIFLSQFLIIRDIQNLPLDPLDLC